MDNPAKKNPTGMTFLLFLVLLFAIVVIELQLIAVQNKLDQLGGPSRVDQTSGEDIDAEYAGKPDFLKRTLEFTSNSPITDTVMAVPADTLIGLRCTEVMVNDGDDKYWWRSPYEHDMYDEVDDPLAVSVLGEINESLPADKTVISSRFCETEYGNIIGQYVAADAEDFGNRGFYHGRNTEAFVTVLSPEGHFEDGGISFKTAVDWPYAICRYPIQLTNTGDLYILCPVASGADVSSTMHIVNLTTGTSTEKLVCTYERADGSLVETCLEN